MTVDRVMVRDLTGRLSSRLVEAIEGDTSSVGGFSAGDGQRRVGLREDRPRLELLMGRWMAEEIARLNQSRLQRGDGLLDEFTERTLRAAAYAETVGAGPLEPYMHDPDVEEIDVNSHRVTWVSYSDGRKEALGQLWDSADDLYAFQRRLTLSMGVAESRLDEQSPMVTLQAPDGSRIVMVLGGPGRSGVSSEPRIAIRRFTINQVGLDGLALRGLFPQWLVPQLEALVQAGMTILISGGPGAGKTTLLKELLGAVSPLERIVTVEKGLLELRLEDDPRHPDAPALYTRQANTEGRGAVTARELVELTRRLNPDRVIVGELVEDEALEMLDVASMCKRGSMATIHAHTVEAVLSRLAFYVAKSNTKLPEYAVWGLIAETIDFVIHIDLVRNTMAGSPQRCVTSIVEYGGRGENGGVRSTETWGMDEDGRFAQRNPVSERHLRRLRLAGVADGLFVPNDGLVGAMNRDDLMLVLAALLLVLGAAVIWSGLHHEPSPARPPSMLRIPIVVALVTGSLVVAISGWIIPSVVIGAIVGWLANSVRRRQGAVDVGVERTEALASWVENVRDVLQSGNQPVGAIGATTETCPPSIRPHVRLLFARLSAGQPAELAFRRFADDMDEPLADLVAVGLLIAVSRGAETQDVLSALAVQARHQADRRRIVEAERAPMRREVMMVSLVMCALLGGVFLFARSSYLNAYDDVSGQIFLALILVGYGALLVWVGRLATFSRPSRFLTLRQASS